MIGDEPPAFMRLTFDVGFAGLPLRIERVEFEIKIMLGRFAGIDRAALGFWNSRPHGLRSPPSRGDIAAADLSPGRCAAMACRGLVPKSRARCRPLGTPGTTPGCVSRNRGPLVDPKTKKAGTVPGCTGDSPRDGGQAGIGRLVPDVAICDDRDSVALTLVFAQEHGAGLEAPRVIAS